MNSFYIVLEYFDFLQDFSEVHRHKKMYNKTVLARFLLITRPLDRLEQVHKSQQTRLNSRARYLRPRLEKISLESCPGLGFDLARVGKGKVLLVLASLASPISMGDTADLLTGLGQDHLRMIADRSLPLQGD